MTFFFCFFWQSRIYTFIFTQKTFVIFFSLFTFVLFYFILGSAWVGLTGASGDSKFTPISITSLIFINNVTNPCEKNNCSANATCVPAGSSYNCTCLSGFIGNGTTCTATNPCEINDCSVNATCVPAGFTYSCTCLSGFIGNGTTCTITNPCEINNCSGNATCVPAGSSYICTCLSGLIGNGTTCIATNPCEVNDCSPNATCVPAGSTYDCTCLSGFIGNGTTCTATNPCEKSDCSPNATCTSDGSSYNCTCPSGFFGNGTSCTATNPCEKSDCSPNATCTPDGSSYNCTCPSGFFGNGTTCTVLPVLIQCTNASCGTGYVCAPSRKFCVDINECDIENICPAGDKCTNFPGSFSCTPEYLATPKMELLEYEINGTTLDISLGWSTATADKLSCYYSCEFSVNSMSFAVIYNGTERNYTFVANLVPVKLSFRVQANCGGMRSNYSDTLELTPPGCLNSICDKSIGEDCTTCPQDCDCAAELVCTPPCANGGACQNGGCICPSPFSGPDCTSATSPVNVTYNNTKPDIHVRANDAIFRIEILEIAEFDEFSNKIAAKNYTLGDLQPNVTETANSVSYFYSFENDATANISATLFQKGTVFEFAQQNISIAPNSLKISLTVTNWDFASIKNSLHITAKATSLADTCKNGASYESQGTWIFVESGMHTLFGKFAKNGLVDGAAMPVMAQFDESNHVASLQVPHFWNEAVLDPDFAVLLGQSSDGCKRSKRKVGLYVGVSIAVVVVVIATLAAIHWILTRDKRASHAEFESVMQRAKLKFETHFQRGNDDL
eukprot:Phypoly_transcript_01926.p1 GENE.Phypoly_transcript_01926~~Phypoly_transcript_01926.p1  ORF type:complete len:787 (+),score=76.61 Phypoly_transcript_01926:659-3019(+)